MWRESLAWRRLVALAVGRHVGLEDWLDAEPPFWLPAADPYWRAVAVGAGIDPAAWDAAWAEAHAVSEAWRRELRNW